MPDPNPAALEFLLTRRSRPAKTLGLPVPTPEQLMPILTAASRSPDHGKLEPWRFIVLEGAALRRLGNDARTRAAALGFEAEQADKGAQQFETGNLAVAVIEVQKPSDKIPALEQTYAVGGVCLALLNAALASGWGANWLTGWPSHDHGFMMQALGLAENERIAGFIHIGTETSAPPDRPRPDLDQIVSWRSA
ncbi:MAG: nitroreductase [Rhodobacterales bacterium]|nr:nitroreductase [Rhodobacterales bacterium]MDX5411483.1 nitroreductase [Rhodobacterales bacterium]